MAGLTQIRIYGRRRELIGQLASLINDSVRSSLSYSLVTRGFTFYETVISIVLMCVAVFVGISQSTAATASLYGIIIIYLFEFSDMYQTFLKLIIDTESILISYERIAQTIALQPEK
jgi:hypothetical protein